MDKKTKKIVIGGGIAALAGWGLYRALAKEEPSPPLPDPDKATLWGIVKDTSSGDVISGVRVACDNRLVSTDNNGRYEIPNFIPGSYTVKFTDPQGRYRPLTLTAELEAGKTTRLDALLKPVETVFAVLHGKITDSITGSPIPDILVYILYRDLWARTDASGYYEIRDISPGVQDIDIQDDLYGMYEFESVTIELKAGDNALDVQLTPIGEPPQPPPGLASLYGQVTDAETGSYLYSILVTIPEIGVRTRTNLISGYYEIEDISPGTYNIHFEDDRQKRYEPKDITIELEEGNNFLDVQLIPIDIVGFTISIINPPAGATSWSVQFKDSSLWGYNSGWLGLSEVWHVPEDLWKVYVRIKVANVPENVVLIDEGDLDPIYWQNRQYEFDCETLELYPIG